MIGVLVSGYCRDSVDDDTVRRDVWIVPTVPLVLVPSRGAAPPWQ